MTTLNYVYIFYGEVQFRTLKKPFPSGRGQGVGFDWTYKASIKSRHCTVLMKLIIRKSQLTGQLVRLRIYLQLPEWQVLHLRGQKPNQKRRRSDPLQGQTTFN